jgi:hypothetical protein
MKLNNLQIMFILFLFSIVVFYGVYRTLNLYIWYLYQKELKMKLIKRQMLIQGHYENLKELYWTKKYLLL